VHEQHPSVVVDDRGLGTDLRRDVAELAPQPFERVTIVDLRDARVLVRGQREQPFVALTVERALGEIETGRRDRADFVEEGQDVDGRAD
jgi:hypothetical protein